MTSGTSCPAIQNEMVRSRIFLHSFVTRHPIVSTVLENTHIVWTPGQGDTFTLQVEMTVPKQLIIYPLQKITHYVVSIMNGLKFDYLHSDLLNH